MSVRVGHLMRHEDVHGVSGTGKVADVFEATNGKCIVVWISPHSSTNVYDNVKHVESTHSHGGKSMVIWDWESAPDPDPMDLVKERIQAIEDEPVLTDEEMEEIAEAAANEAKKKVAEKIAEKMAEMEDEDEEEEPSKKPPSKKKKTE